MTENFIAAPSVIELVSGLCTCVYRFQKTQLQGLKGEVFARLHGRKRGRYQGQKRGEETLDCATEEFPHAPTKSSSLSCLQCCKLITNA